jgi:hypothetical protein
MVGAGGILGVKTIVNPVVVYTGVQIAEAERIKIIQPTVY